MSATPPTELRVVGVRLPRQRLVPRLRERGLAVDRWTLDGEALSAHVGYGPTTVAFEDLTNVVGTYTASDESGDARVFTQKLAQLCAARERCTESWAEARDDDNLVLQDHPINLPATPR